MITTTKYFIDCGGCNNRSEIPWPRAAYEITIGSYQERSLHEFCSRKCMLKWVKEYCALVVKADPKALDH